jgi:N-acetyl-anhydromuramyl-L-alanine amidase AmpD
MLVKLGDKGAAVKEIQSLLKQKGFYFGGLDGDFGPMTEDAVERFQSKKKVTVDGVVGPTTYKLLLSGLDTDRQGYSADIPDTDNKLQYLGKYTTKNGLEIDRVYLDTDEYVRDYGVIKPKNLFIHHTAGWDNPYNTINSWNRDDRGRVATQYVLGGLNIKGNTKHDGTVVECFPDGYIGWHLGKVGNFNASKYSVGIELNNFGYVKLKNGKYYNYVGSEVPSDQVVDLGYKFRGYQYWHKYSDAQIESLRKLILHIKDIYPTIDISKGLIEELETKSAHDAFEFNSDAYNGRVYGMWTHTNVRKDKFDCFPQQELVDMLKSLK